MHACACVHACVQSGSKRPGADAAQPQGKRTKGEPVNLQVAKAHKWADKWLGKTEPLLGVRIPRQYKDRLLRHGETTYYASEQFEDNSKARQCAVSHHAHSVPAQRIHTVGSACVLLALLLTLSM